MHLYPYIAESARRRTQEIMKTALSSLSPTASQGCGFRLTDRTCKDVLGEPVQYPIGWLI